MFVGGVCKQDSYSLKDSSGRLCLELCSGFKSFGLGFRVGEGFGAEGPTSEGVNRALICGFPKIRLN